MSCFSSQLSCVSWYVWSAQWLKEKKRRETKERKGMSLPCRIRPGCCMSQCQLAHCQPQMHQPCSITQCISPASTLQHHAGYQPCISPASIPQQPCINLQNHAMQQSCISPTASCNASCNASALQHHAMHQPYSIMQCIMQSISPASAPQQPCINPTSAYRIMQCISPTATLHDAMHHSGICPTDSCSA